MKMFRIPTGPFILATVLFAACFGDNLVAPDQPLEPELAVDRPRVQLLRYAMGRKVASDTVRITNNGEGPLGHVVQVGGVDYLTTARVGWLRTELVNVRPDEALLIFWPTYAEEEQEQDDLAEVVLKAESSPELRFVTVSARTLPGANFEFSVSPVVFAAAPGDSPSSQRITVRNGGNGTLKIHPPTVVDEGEASGWLSVVPSGGTEKAPEFEIRADPEAVSGGGLFSAHLLFESLETEETRAKSAALEVKLNVGQPELGVSATALGFTVVRGAPDPVSQHISTSNVGAGPFSALGALGMGQTIYGPGAEGWLEVEFSEAGGVEVSALTTGLAAGQYEAEFPINSENSSENSGSQVIQVTLSVEAPVLTPSSRTLSFGIVEGESVPPPPDTVRLTNTGSGSPSSLGDLTLGPLDPSVPWLVTRLVEDQIIFTPTPATTNLTEGDYSTQLPVHSDYGGSDTVEVVLSVSRGVDEPVLSLSATALEFNGVRGDHPPPPQSVLVSNSGGGSLGQVSVGTPVYAGETGWLTVSTVDGVLTLAVSVGTLSEGIHVATASVNSVSGGNGSVEVTFTLGSPVLTASATSASFEVPVGGAVPPPEVITLANTGPGNFASLGNVTAGPVSYPSNPGWLTFSLSGPSLTLSVTTVPGADGTYSATVPVVSTEGGSLSIEVTLTVLRAHDDPDLVVSPTSIRMDALRDGPNPTSQTVLLSNGGGGSLGTLSLAETSTWLTTSGAGPSVTLSAETAGLPKGTYTATVVFSSTDGGDETVDVTLEVSAPVLTLSSASASFSAVEGDVASLPSTPITLQNTGAGDFGDLGNVTLGTVSAGWLDAALTGGGNTVTLTATPLALGVGTHTETVPVNSVSGGNSSVVVTLTIAPTPEDPDLILSSATVAFFAEEGKGDPGTQWVSVSNGGGGGFPALDPLSLGAVDYGGGEAGWLTATVAGETISLVVVTGTTPAGTHQATVLVSPTLGTPRTVTVVFTVEATLGPTTLELGASSVRFTAVSNGTDPPQREVAVINKGAGDLGNIDVDVSAITYVPDLPASRWLEDTQNSNSEVTLIPRTGSLAPGSYSASVPVTSNNGGDKTLAVSFTVESSILSLDTRSVSVSAVEGGGNPADQTVGINNSGAGDYDDLGTVSLGTVVYDPVGEDWLTATVGTEEVELQTATGSLSAGIFSATVLVSSSSGGSEDLFVTFTVSRDQEPPELVVSPSTVRMDGIQGGTNPPGQTVIVSNSGGGDLGSLDVTESAAWLSTSGPGSTVDLAAELGGLAAGSYTTTVQFTSTGGGDESVDVTLVVAEPILTLSTQGVSFTGLVAGSSPSNQTITVENTGAGALADLGEMAIGTITYGSGASGWLSSPASSSAVAGGVFDIEVSQTGLASGSYTATVPVTSQYGGDQSVAVTLSVVREADPPLLLLSPDALRFGALVGGESPEPQSTYISNGGGGTLGTLQIGPASYGPEASGWLEFFLDGNVISVTAMNEGFEEGTYAATLPVVSSKGGSGSMEVILEVGSPRITVAPRTVSFGDTVGGSNPSPGIVAIANTGGGNFSSLGEISLGETVYGAKASGWLSASLNGSSLSLTAQTGEMEAQTEPYGALLPILSLFGGFDTVTVAFTVAPGASPPRLALSVDSVTFDGVVGGVDPSAQTVLAFNGGGGTLGALSVKEVIYHDPSVGWLTGSIEGMAFRFVPANEGLPGGVHRATVVVESENGGEAQLETRLNLAQPVLSLSSGSVTFSNTVGSPDTLRSKVFISNTGGGDRSSLGTLTVLPLSYPEGESGWLVTTPLPGTDIGASLVELDARGEALAEGTSVAVVQIQSQWGGVEAVTVTFFAREPDRSFDLPIIELVQETSEGGTGEFVPVPGDSVVARAQSGATAQLGLRIGVRNGSETRVTLSGLRVSVPTYPVGQQAGWITGAFLDKTTATFSDPAELSVSVSPAGLSAGRYESSLVVSSESAGLEAVESRTLRVILVVG